MTMREALLKLILVQGWPVLGSLELVVLGATFQILGQW